MENNQLSDWKLDGRRFLYLGLYVQKMYEEGKISKKNKKEIEKKLDILDEYLYWKKNPHIKGNPLLCEVVVGFLKDLHFT